MPVELLRQKTIFAAQSTHGLPNLTEYYMEDDEAKAIRDYRQWEKENERIKMIERLAKGKSWQSMTRGEREKYEGELAIMEMEEQRVLQNSGGWGIIGDEANASRGSDGALVLRTGHGGKKRNRSGSTGGRGGRKRRGGRPTTIQTDASMSGAL